MGRWTGWRVRGSMAATKEDGGYVVIGEPSTVAASDTSARGLHVSMLLSRLALWVEALVVVTIFANIVLTFTNAVVRYLTNQDFPWATDTWAIMIAIITFLGAPAYFRRGAGMAYTALIDQSYGMRKQVLQANGLAIFLGVRDRASRVSVLHFQPAHAVLAGVGHQLRLRGDVAGYRAYTVLHLYDREAGRIRSQCACIRHSRWGGNGGGHADAALGIRPGSD